MADAEHGTWRDDPARRHRYLSLATPHVGTVTGLAILLTAANILIVSHGSIPVALIIASEADTVQIALGTLVQLLPAILTFILCYLVLVADSTSDVSEQRTARVMGVVVALLLLPFASLPLLVFIFFAGELLGWWPGVGTLFVWMKFRPERQRQAQAAERWSNLRSDAEAAAAKLEAALADVSNATTSDTLADETAEIGPSRENLAREALAQAGEQVRALQQNTAALLEESSLAAQEVERVERELSTALEARRRTPRALLALVAYFGVLLLLQFLIADPWLPREAIHFDQQDTPLTGYVLSASDERLIMLTEAREIVIYMDDGSATRTYCERPVPRFVPWFAGSMWDLVWQPDPGLPQCP